MVRKHLNFCHSSVGWNLGQATKYKFVRDPSLRWGDSVKIKNGNI